MLCIKKTINIDNTHYILYNKLRKIKKFINDENYMEKLSFKNIRLLTK